MFEMQEEIKKSRHEDGMNMVKLGNIATYVNGYAFKPDDRGDYGLPIIRIQDLTGNTYDLGFYDGDYPKKIEINNGDILISWSASLGVYEWKRGKALLNQHIFKVVFDKEVDVSKKYFVYAVKYKLEELSRKSHGATMKHVIKKDFDNTKIPFPSFVRQKEIAERLEKTSKIISGRKKQLQKLDELIQARFVELFGEPSTNPRGWTETTVGDECFYIKDGPHKSLPDIGKENGGHPFISVRNIVNGYIDFSTARYISDEDFAEAIKKCHPEKGDILYSKGGTTGIAKFIDIDEEFANWVHVAVLKFDKSKLNGIFFENMLNGAYCYEQSQRLTKGIANRDLVLSAMAQIKMYRPPIELQNQFAGFVNQVNKSKVEIQQALEKTQLLFDSLMQQYFG